MICLGLDFVVDKTSTALLSATLLSSPYTNQSQSLPYTLFRSRKQRVPFEPNVLGGKSRQVARASKPADSRFLMKTRTNFYEQTKQSSINKIRKNKKNIGHAWSLRR